MGLDQNNPRGPEMNVSFAQTCAVARPVNVHCIVSTDSPNTRWFCFSCVAPPCTSKTPTRLVSIRQLTTVRMRAAFYIYRSGFTHPPKTQITSACRKMQNNRLCQQMTVKKPNLKPGFPTLHRGTESNTQLISERTGVTCRWS